MKILVAIDGSKPALHAAEYAAKLLGQLAVGSSAITLMSVHDDVGLGHAKAIVGRDAVAGYLKEQSENDLRSAKDALNAAGVKYDIEVRTGPVAQEIVDCAKKESFDLIVLGAKGRGSVADLLLGSVAHRILAKAEMPVILVK
jgi:nucleotide-binding universal stress UspA family protein